MNAAITYTLDDTSILERVTLRVYKRLEKIEPRQTWLERTEGSLWHELVACILGSRVSFEHAQTATKYLSTRGLLDRSRYISCRDEFEFDIAEALSRPICLPLTRSGSLSRYRYPRLRARHIRATVESLYMAGYSIRGILDSSSGSHNARQRLMSATLGIGPKQSSLFLRNVGYAQDLAILDSHVMTYMNLLDLTSTGMKEVSKLATYEAVEERLTEYSQRLNVSLPNLDTAIWVVMRVFNREFLR